MKRSFPITAAMLIVTLMLGCESMPTGEHSEQALRIQADAAVSDFKQHDPTVTRHFEQAYAYVIFPEVTKGAAGIGGAHGIGEVRRDGKVLGYAELSQGTLGAQLGGQVYSELIFFEDEAALERFKAGDVKFSAQASAIAAKAGASADADYERGVLVFSLGKGGLMFEASIGGQDFDYRPASLSLRD